MSWSSRVTVLSHFKERTIFGGGSPLGPPYFQTKLKPKGWKNIFWVPPPPPPPQLISRSGSGTDLKKGYKSWEEFLSNIITVRLVTQGLPSSPPLPSYCITSLLLPIPVLRYKLNPCLKLVLTQANSISPGFPSFIYCNFTPSNSNSWELKLCANSPK